MYQVQVFFKNTLRQMALKLEMSKKKDIRIIEDLGKVPQLEFERDRFV